MLLPSLDCSACRAVAEGLPASRQRHPRCTESVHTHAGCVGLRRREQGVATRPTAAARPACIPPAYTQPLAPVGLRQRSEKPAAYAPLRPPSAAGALPQARLRSLGAPAAVELPLAPGRPLAHGSLNPTRRGSAGSAAAASGVRKRSRRLGCVVDAH
eukprot:356704-Chlamydomonas_euryale.AAC.1